MTRQRCARAILATDGFGCALAAVAALGSRRFGPAVEPISKVRVPLAVALSVTSGLLLSSAGCAQVLDADLERAAMVNSIWVFACLTGLRCPQTRLSRTLLAATAALDGGAAVVQWLCRSNDDAADSRFNG